MAKFFYTCGEPKNEDGSNLTEFPTKWSFEYPEYLVEDAAKYDHDHCEGYDKDWPIVFHIYDEEHKLLGSYNVERDYDPVFTATEIEDKSGR